MASDPRPPEEIDDCEYSGHHWAPAGGGLWICMLCEAEEWEDE